jgi:hypothetical protein
VPPVLPYRTAVDVGLTRFDPPKGAESPIQAPLIAEALPPIETVASGTLTSPEGESDDPKNKKDGRCYPQKVHCESSSKKNQDKQKRENQYH